MLWGDVRSTIKTENPVVVAIVRKMHQCNLLIGGAIPEGIRSGSEFVRLSENATVENLM